MKPTLIALLALCLGLGIWWYDKSVDVDSATTHITKEYRNLEEKVKTANLNNTRLSGSEIERARTIGIPAINEYVPPKISQAQHEWLAKHWEEILKLQNDTFNWSNSWNMEGTSLERHPLTVVELYRDTNPSKDDVTKEEFEAIKEWFKSTRSTHANYLREKRKDEEMYERMAEAEAKLKAKAEKEKRETEEMWERNFGSKNLSELKAKAESGNVDVQISLGDYYRGKEGSIESGLGNNKEEAAKWYRKAAEQGNAKAQLRVGEYYEEKGNKEAAKWYLKAAEQGNAKAQVNIGKMYAKGEVVPENGVTAYAWFNIAAANDSTKNIINAAAAALSGEVDINERLKKISTSRGIGFLRNQPVTSQAFGMFEKAMKAKGENVDPLKFKAWVTAKSHQDSDAQKNKAIIAKEMTAEQVAKAQELSDEMLRRNPNLLK